METHLTITKEQLSYLKGLDSKKKQRKFLLDCFVENAIIESEKNNEPITLKLKYEKLYSSLDDYKNQEVKDVFGILLPSEIIKGIQKAKDQYALIQKKKESREIIEKSKKSQPPMYFCVKITDENQKTLDILFSKFNSVSYPPLIGNYLHTNSLFTFCEESTSYMYNQNPSPIVTTSEFLKYIGREDLIERKSITFKDRDILMEKLTESQGQIRKLKESNLSPKQIEAVLEWLSGYEQLKGSVIPIRFKDDAVPEKSESLTESVKEFLSDENILKMNGFGKVDLSKELYLTYEDSDGSYCIRVTDFEKGEGFGFGFYGDWVNSEFTWKTHPNDWRKSTPEEIKSMLIKKLEADGLKVGSKFERIGFNVSDRPHITEMTTVDDSTFFKDVKWFYSVADDFLEFHGFVVYSKGKFATIIPQEEPKNEIPELVNSSNYIKEILVVDFENVSQEENPQ